MIIKDIGKIKKLTANNISNSLIDEFSNWNRVFKKNLVEVMTKSENLKVGDIIEVNANQRIPADLLLLQTS